MSKPLNYTLEEIREAQDYAIDYHSHTGELTPEDVMEAFRWQLNKIGEKKVKESYKEQLRAKRTEMMEHLNSEGFTVDEMRDEIGFIISLTRVGLSLVYAEVSQEEIEYHVDNPEEE